MQIIKPEVPYVISTNTLILQTIRKENCLQTLVIERDKQFIHPRKAMHLIRASCRYYGTSFEVATNTAKKVLNNRQKVPIVVAYDHGIPIIMIPTLSSSSDQNIWIALHAITNFSSTKKGRTTINLINQYTINIESSETTIQRQIALAYLLQRDYQAKYIHFNGPWFHSSPNLQ